MQIACDEARIVELRVHPGHRGFLTGGRRGSVVVRVVGSQDSRVLIETDEARDSRILIKQGWRALACDGTWGTGEEVVRAAGLARREGRDCVIAFEIDPDTAKTLGQRLLRKQLARRQLQHALGNLSLSELSQLSRDQAAAYLRSLRVQWLVVDASAVFEVEVLLGRQQGCAMQQAKDLFTAVKRGDLTSVKQIINADGFQKDILLQRDGAGNVPLHHAATLDIARLLVDCDPSAKVVRNMHGQAPVMTYLMRHPEELAAAELLAESDRDLLNLDEHGISAAMVIQGPGRTALESRLPPWNSLQTALESEVPMMLSRLETIDSELSWMDMFAFHCFGERQVWHKRQHSARSRARLLIFWAALRRVLQAVEGGDKDAVDCLGQLLQASRGPRCPPMDPREPYRVGLVRVIWRMQTHSHAERAALYEALHGSGAEWLKSEQDFLAEDIARSDEGLRFRTQVPTWLENHDLHRVYEDLQEVGCIGAFSSRDGIYDMLQLADAKDQESTVAEDDCFLARWFAAWLQGLCQQNQAFVGSTMGAILGSKAGSFSCRPVAKPFSRICEKVVETFSEQSLSSANNCGNPRAFFRQAAAFVNDINACRYIADSPEELHGVIAAIQDAVASGLIHLRQIANGFHVTKQCDALVNGMANYPMITVWVEAGNHMLVELQLHLRSMYLEYPFHQLTCQFHAGRFDWQHLSANTQDIWQKVKSEELEEKRRQEEEEHRRLEEDRRRAEEEEAAERRRKQEEEEQARLRKETIITRKSSGASVAELVEAGFSLAELSLIASSLKEQGRTRIEMERMGWPLAELKAVGQIPSVLRLLFDYADRDLRNVGFPASALLQDTGHFFSPENLRNAGYSARELYDAGISGCELQLAGFTVRELVNECIPLEEA